MGRPRTTITRYILEPGDVICLVSRTQYIDISITIYIRRMDRIRTVEATVDLPTQRKLTRPGSRCRRVFPHVRLIKRRTAGPLQPDRRSGRKHHLHLLTRKEVVRRIERQRRCPGPAVRTGPRSRRGTAHHEVRRRGRRHRLAERRTHVRRHRHVDVVLYRRRRSHRRWIPVLPPHERISIVPCSQDIQIPVPIHIRSDYARRPIECPIHHARRPRTAVARRILPPRHLIPNTRRPQHIHIPIPIHVRRMDADRPTECSVNSMSRPRTTISRCILPPRNSIPIVCRTRYIQIAIPVDIRRVHPERSVDDRHIVRRPRAAVTRRILPQDDLVLYRPRSQHIHIPIAVHVGSVHRMRPVERPIHEVRRPRTTVTRRVLKPGDLIVGIRSTQHIHVPIPVHIRRIDTIGLTERCLYILLGPRAAVTRRILPPGDGIGGRSRTQDIHVAITIHIHRIDRMHAAESPIHSMQRPVAPITRRVLPPGNRIVVVRRSHHVRIAITIHIRRDYRNWPAGSAANLSLDREFTRSGSGRRRKFPHMRLIHRHAAVALQSDRRPGRKYHLHSFTRLEIVRRIERQRRRPLSTVRPGPYSRLRPVHQEVRGRGRRHRLAERRAHVRRQSRVDVVLHRRCRTDRWYGDLIQIDDILLGVIPRYQVQIAIAVQICESSQVGSIGTGAEVAAPSRHTPRAVVQINHVLLCVVAHGHIQVPIPVSIPQRQTVRHIGAGAEVAATGRHTPSTVVQINHVLLRVVAHTDIQITIPIQITQRQSLGILTAGAEIQTPSRQIPRAVVQINHVLLAFIAHSHIQIPISIHITQIQRARIVGAGAEVQTPGRQASRPIVQINHVLPRLVAHGSVQIPITVQITQHQTIVIGRIGASAEVQATRRQIARTVVQIHHVLLGIIPHGSVQIAVAVQIAQRYGVAVVGTGAEVQATRRQTSRPVIQIHHVLLILIPHGHVQIPIPVQIARRHQVGILTPRPKILRYRRETHRPDSRFRRKLPHVRIGHRRTARILHPNRRPGREHYLDLLTRPEVVRRIKRQRRRPVPAVAPRPRPRHRAVHHEVRGRARAHRRAEHPIHIRRLCRVDVVFHR